MAKYEPINLSTLAGGAAVDLVDHELTKVLTNIADVNTSPKAAREITLKIKIKPSDSREIANAEVSCVSKLAPVRPADTVLYLGKSPKDGKLVAVESNPRQMHLGDTEEERRSPNVVALSRDTAKGS
jgi:hypothetical protein